MTTRLVRLKPKPEIVAATVGDEVLLINLATGKYYNIKGTGDAVWPLIEQRHRLDDIVAFIKHSYSIPARRARNDIWTLADHLLGEGLVDYCNDGPETLNEIRPAGRYVSPQLSAFDDMTEHLALFPPSSPERAASGLGRG